MVVLLLAAHQGEEFVLILPAILLLGALLVIRWANQEPPDEDSPESAEEVQAMPGTFTQSR